MLFFFYSGAFREPFLSAFDKYVEILCYFGSFSKVLVPFGNFLEHFFTNFENSTEILCFFLCFYLKTPKFGISPKIREPATALMHTAGEYVIQCTLQVRMLYTAYCRCKCCTQHTVCNPISNWTGWTCRGFPLCSSLWSLGLMFNWAFTSSCVGSLLVKRCFDSEQRVGLSSEL